MCISIYCGSQFKVLTRPASRDGMVCVVDSVLQAILPPPAALKCYVAWVLFYEVLSAIESLSWARLAQTLEE